MSKISVQITTFFENPFWVTVYEREEKGKFQVCKITFGKEPKEYEIYDFLLSNWCHLRFSTTIVSLEETAQKKKNPKRIQREIQKLIEEKRIGTKAQQALQGQREEQKIQSRKMNRVKREQLKKEKFELRCTKRKKKHKGR